MRNYQLQSEFDQFPVFEIKQEKPKYLLTYLQTASTSIVQFI